MERSCTDVLMCLIFVVFFCGMFATAAYGYKNGDPTKLIQPYDSSGKSYLCHSLKNINECRLIEKSQDLHF
jgi:hypothetical protein